MCFSCYGEGGSGNNNGHYTYQSMMIKDAMKNLEKFGFQASYEEKEEVLTISNDFLNYKFTRKNILDIKWPDNSFSLASYFGEENIKKYFWFIMDVVAAIKDKARPPRIYISDKVTAFNAECIGPKVLDKFAFFTEVYEASTKFQWGASKKKNYGEGILILNEGINKKVLSGFGKRSPNPEDYVLRSYNNRVEAFLKRSKAEDHRGVVVQFLDKQKKREAEGATEPAPPFAELEILDVITLSGPSVISSEKDFVKEIIDEVYSEFTIKDFIEFARKNYSHNQNWCLVSD